MTKPGGHLKLYRCFRRSWQWEKPLWRAAWVWLLIEARFQDSPEDGLARGQLWVSVRRLAKEWGMSVNGVCRFLDRAVKDGDLIWEKGRCGMVKGFATQIGTQNATQNATQTGTQMGRITILKYDEYQSIDRGKGNSKRDSNGTQTVTQVATILKEGLKNDRRMSTFLEPPAPSPKKSRPPRDDQLKSIDLEALQERFQSVNVDAQYEHWLDYLEATGKTYKNYEAAFRNWLRNASGKYAKRKEPKYAGPDPLEYFNS